MEHFRFNNRSRREGETLGQLVAALRGLASACVFGDQLDSLLRDRFVCGINNTAMQTRLLELPYHSLDNVVKAALAIEAAAKYASEISRATGSPSEEAAFNKLATKDSTCGCCGGAHYPSQCQFSQAQCFTGGKTWHLVRVCRRGRMNSKQKQQPGSSPGTTQARGQGSHRKRTRWQRAAASSSSSVARFHVLAEGPPIFDMWHTGLVPSSVPPYMLTVEICGHPVSMELDTGASASVMVGKLLKRTFPCVSIKASGVMLRSYSGQFSQAQEYQEASLHVVKDVPSLLTKFKSLFQPGVGIFAGMTAGIHVPEGARLHFFKPRRLPFTLKEGVTQKLQRLQREGILVPVKTSEWAAPIAPVLKRDGSVRICGDFKVTISPVATIEKYPLPRIEDIWSALSGGQKFTKLDLRDAYQ
ncbi:uncharacterized protein [Dermacentor albipictus]|uniref:uncharacterized protein n=1 Tax=Dermacentor albipictus TaxID=60249 RepID=UPI0038FCE924